MQDMYWLVAICLLSGCSSQAGVTASSRVGASKDTAAPSGGAPASSETSVSDSDSADTPLVSRSVENVDAGVDGGLNSDGTSKDCQIGKFCVNMNPDGDKCGTLTLAHDIEKKTVPGNLLLVFDQSLSMSDPWGMTGQTKLAAAQTAIANAVMGLQDSLTVGALFFPTSACAGVDPNNPFIAAGLGLIGAAPATAGAGGNMSGAAAGAGAGISLPGIGTVGGAAVEPIDGNGQIPFQSGPDFMQKWQEHWSQAGVGMGIGTPMQEAFDRADAAINAAHLTGDLAVVAVTDGAPNCFPQMDTPTDLEVNRAKQWLDTKNIKTYVVGLPGADGVQLLNDVAAQGGTSEYILPDDPKTLEDKLRALVQETIKTRFESCSIHLMPAANPADKLDLVVVLEEDGSVNRVPHVLTADSGWTISADGVDVELTGQVCSDAMSGRFSRITFEYACKPGDGPPPPPFIQPS